MRHSTSYTLYTAWGSIVDKIILFDTPTYVHMDTHAHTQYTHTYTHTHTHMHDRFQFPTILVFYENMAELLLGESDNFLCNM